MLNNLLETIKNTPLVKFENLTKANSIAIYGKLEYLNAGKSLKSRTSKNMIDWALKNKLLKQGDTIIESSSGNMAIGLAQLCTYYGLNLIVVVDPNAKKSTLDILKVYGATIEKVKQPHRTDGFLGARLERVQQLIDITPNSYWPNQYKNKQNPKTYYATAREIFKEFNEAPDYIFLSVSTCGTLMGFANYIEENKLPTKVIAVDAKGSVIFGKKPEKRIIAGHGASIPSSFLNTQLIYDNVQVSDLDCIRGCWKLLHNEAILAGGSTGGTLIAIENYAEKLPKNSKCVMLVADDGERYLDSIYNKEWIEKQFSLCPEKIKALTSKWPK